MQDPLKKRYVQCAVNKSSFSDPIKD